MTWIAGAVVTAAQLNTNAPQEWTAYTPTLGAATLGTGGTLSGRYVKHGRTVVFNARVKFGTGLVVGSGLNLSLPVARVAFTPTNHDQAAQVILTDAGSTNYFGYGYLGSTTVSVWVSTATGALGSLGATNPFTWAANDEIWVNGVYESA